MTCELGTKAVNAEEGDGLVVLDRAECLRLVAGAQVGRVAAVVGAAPVVMPVNFRLVRDDVVFRTGTGTKLVAAVSRATVSFEVDEIDEGTRSGWSVLITGPASEITAPDEAAAVEERGLRSWAPDRDRYVRIRADVVTGRRLPAKGHLAAVPETGWDWVW